jgi:hypothetical protein
MSTDQRITAAETFLAAVTSHPVTSRPHPVLVREAAEARHHLAKVLDVAREWEDEDASHIGRTAVLPDGGVILTPADARTLVMALSDAAELRSAAGPASAELAARYRALTAALEADQP